MRWVTRLFLSSQPTSPTSHTRGPTSLTPFTRRSPSRSDNEGRRARAKSERETRGGVYGQEGSTLESTTLGSCNLPSTDHRHTLHLSAHFATLLSPLDLGCDCKVNGDDGRRSGEPGRSIRRAEVTRDQDDRSVSPFSSHILPPFPCRLVPRLPSFPSSTYRTAHRLSHSSLTLLSPHVPRGAVRRTKDDGSERSGVGNRRMK